MQTEQLSASQPQGRNETETVDRSKTEDVLLNIAPLGVLLLALLVLGAASVLSVILWPAWPGALVNSLSGAKPKAFWYLSRSSAMVAYVLLWASMATGLAVTNKLLRVWPGGPTLVALHEYASILGLVLAVFHALILLGTGYFQNSLDKILIPFASTNYRPLWVGIGQVALYLLIPVTLSFYVRRWIGYAFWRRLHYVSLALFVLTMLHGLMSGTDSGSLWVRDMYWASATSLVGLVAYRIVFRGAANQAKTGGQLST